MSKFRQKLHASKISFFRDFLIFQVFARRFFVDFKGPGSPPGVIFSEFLRYVFFDNFFAYFLPKKEKMEKRKSGFRYVIYV